jgi:hypothetical protein
MIRAYAHETMYQTLKAEAPCQTYGPETMYHTSSLKCPPNRPCAPWPSKRLLAEGYQQETELSRYLSRVPHL